MEMLITLENMAQTSTAADTYADVNRWMQLFGYTAAQATRAIEKHFQDLSRLTISEDHWNLVRNTIQAQGHDQESYAHHMMHFASSSSTQQQPRPTSSPTKKKITEHYLIELVDGLTAADIQAMAGLSHPPKVSANDSGDKTSAAVDASTLAALEKALPHPFSYIPLPASAAKHLSDISIAPTLGVDATLPQHRISTAPTPLQSEYPVSYFFYGTLAEPDRLARLLDLECETILRVATVSRGRRVKWGPYYALVDGAEGDVVQGWVYEVGTREQEDELRRYEGGSYEVVRCEIGVGGVVGWGLTFRFCGDGGELS
ncbi:hypothetical protein P171DRAFT_519501 [Karstenula rhodostoma CBS 690.94]|uniref:Putative gamma-glutamylcyclotransferase n=1 Tax=Karstenula rhodostoma CBS 690.94 TaxID=1392251 RepID=A0A9P4UCX8_9PLEO|nr:hypothetical protein P171DRAFT_519501 [Karstenula rhodostoma CBS 690.94]